MAVSHMKKLAVYAYRSDSEGLVRKLMSLRCVSLETTDLGEGTLTLDRVVCDRERGEAEQRIAQISEALAKLAKRSRRKKSIFQQKRSVDRKTFLRDGHDRLAWNAVHDTLTTEDRLQKNIAEQQKTDLLITSLYPWVACDVPLSLEGTEKTSHLFGTLPARIAEDTLQAASEQTAFAFESVSQDQTSRYLTITCLKAEEEEVLRALTELGFVRLTFKGVDTVAELALEQAAQKRGELMAEQVRLEDHLDVLAESLGRMEALYDVENTTLEMLKNRQKLAETESCAILVGWVPELKAAKVQKVLDTYDCAYELSDPAPEDDPPVLLQNNSYASNFEWVLGMYSYPKYGSYDPTFIMGIFYFLIFGLMFADCGYGLVLTAVCLLAVKFLHPGERMKQSLMMFAYCGISCMIMGILFASYFGDFLSYFFGNRLVITFDLLEGNGPIYYLLISLGIGAVHLIAGMAVKFIHLCKQGQVWDAIFDIGAWWLIFAGLALVFVLKPAIPGYVLLGSGLALIVFFAGRGTKNPILRLGKGLLGIYNGVNYVSDLLSYSRVMALGLASAVIAKVVNQVGFMLAGSPVGVIFMILIFIIGHALNLVINLLGTFVHTARLQYIEFFGKFYEDGGTPFRAELPSEKYTVDVSDASEK